MARTTERLTALKVQRAKRPGMYPDGHGLYLQVTEVGASWVYRFMLDGRAREMGLGPLHTITLAKARERAAQARELRLDGVDPIERRRSEQAAQRVAGATAMSFRQCGDAFIASHKPRWTSAVHGRQWTNSLAKHVYPVIGGLPVHDIDTKLVMKVVEPLWRTIPETASRLRGRIESILDWAKVRDYRAGENPARWRGHLDKLLPARSKVRQHLAALPYAELPGFIAALREQEGIAARALEFTILTATRVGETRFARWSEFNLLDKIWIVPAKRMKAQREHRIPLSARTLAILQEMQSHRLAGDADGYVFPGGKVGRPLADTVLLRLLQRMGRGDLTAHGFRSSFRDWCAERTNVPSEVAEMALAHAVGNKVEQAYRRGDMFEKRRRLMQQWATFCTTPVDRSQNKVVSLRAS
jgi:integrase